MLLRRATLDDIPAILALERTPMAREFVGQWSEERHRSTLSGGDAHYYVSETEWGEVQAYAILRGIQETSRAIELKRIVVAVPERGLGRRVLKELVRIAFRELNAHRLFLDVYDDNARARHLYESLGFQYEGVMREAAQRDGHWCQPAPHVHPGIRVQLTCFSIAPIGTAPRYTLLNDGNYGLRYGNRHAFPGRRIDRRTSAMGLGELANRRGHRLHCGLRFHG